MVLKEKINVKDLASCVSATVIGDEKAYILGINEIHRTNVGDLTFVDHPKFHALASNCAASFILTNEVINCNKPQLLTNDPFRDFLYLLEMFGSTKKSSFFENIKGASISITAKIGKNTQIMSGSFIGNNVEIGDNCMIYPNVTILDNCILKNNVIIHPNTVIGGDAYYYKKRATEMGNYFEKFICYGNVVIENNVEIGSNCTIDKGVTSSTIIGEGTKIDNLVMIGHGVIIGKNCLLAAQVGIAGKTILEDNVTIWGQVGVSKNLLLRKDCVVLAKSGVSKNLEAGKTYFGIPAEEAKIKWKEIVEIKNIVKNRQK